MFEWVLLHISHIPVSIFIKKGTHYLFLKCPVNFHLSLLAKTFSRMIMISIRSFKTVWISSQTSPETYENQYFMGLSGGFSKVRLLLKNIVFSHSRQWYNFQKATSLSILWFCVPFFIFCWFSVCIQPGLHKIYLT